MRATPYDLLRAPLATLSTGGTYTSGGANPRTLTPVGAVRTVVR